MFTLRNRVLAGIASVALVGCLVTGTAQAADGTVVATGLDNPRHLAFAPNGDLYIAEGGAAGNDCVAVGDDSETCAGLTGAVTRVSHKGVQERVVTGLLSHNFEGEIVGPSDVGVRGKTVIVAVGLGGAPELRDQLVAGYGAAYAVGSTVQSIRLQGSPRTSTLADLAAFEQQYNPHPAQLDTNLVAVTADGNGWLVADAGGNSVLRVDHRGELSLLATLPDSLALAPSFLGLPPDTMIPVQAVPTAIERGPDGAIYVGVLTGFPFPVGGASIFRIAGDGSVTAWATGLTNVTDLTFDEAGNLYAVQLANEGLLGAPIGSLVRVEPGANHRDVVATDLPAPYGVTIRNGAAYVTINSIAVGQGQVVRYDLG